MTQYLTGDSRRGFTGRKFYTGPLWVEEREGRSHHRALLGKTWPRQFVICWVILSCKIEKKALWLDFWFWMVVNIKVTTICTTQWSYLHHKSKTGRWTDWVWSHTRHRHGPRTARAREGRASPPPICRVPLQIERTNRKENNVQIHD